MPTSSIRVHAGKLIIFEGLDRTGKSTQVRALEARSGEPAPVVAHMPSGLTALTRDIYAVTEGRSIQSAWARQLLHLACHAETRDALVAARADHGLLLDRWWWSTVAYGWYGSGLADVLPRSVFDGLIASIWSGIEPDLIFLFLNPYANDTLNRTAVKTGYRDLADQSSAPVFEVPTGSAKEVTQVLERELLNRGLADTHTA